MNNPVKGSTNHTVKQLEFSSYKEMPVLSGPWIPQLAYEQSLYANIAPEPVVPPRGNKPGNFNQGSVQQNPPAYPYPTQQGGYPQQYQPYQAQNVGPGTFMLKSTHELPIYLKSYLYQWRTNLNQLCNSSRWFLNSNQLSKQMFNHKVRSLVLNSVMVFAIIVPIKASVGWIVALVQGFHPIK